MNTSERGGINTRPVRLRIARTPENNTPKQLDRLDAQKDTAAEVKAFTAFTEYYNMRPEDAARGYKQPIVHSFALHGDMVFMEDNKTGAIVESHYFAPKGLTESKELRDIDNIQQILPSPIEISSQGKIADISAGISSRADFLFVRVEPMLRSASRTKDRIKGGRDSTMAIFPLDQHAMLHTPDTKEELLRHLNNIPDVLLTSHGSTEITRDLLTQAIERINDGSLPFGVIDSALIRGKEQVIREGNTLPLGNKVSIYYSGRQEALSVARLGALPEDPDKALAIIKDVADRKYEGLPPYFKLSEQEVDAITPEIDNAIRSTIAGERVDRYSVIDPLAERLEAPAQEKQQEPTQEAPLPAAAIRQEEQEPQKIGWREKLRTKKKNLALKLGAVAMSVATLATIYTPFSGTEEPELAKAPAAVAVEKPNNTEPIELSDTAGPAFIEEAATVELGDSVWELSANTLEARGIDDPTNQEILDTVQATIETNSLDPQGSIDPSDVISVTIPANIINH